MEPKWYRIKTLERLSFQRTTLLKQFNEHTFEPDC